MVKTLQLYSLFNKKQVFTQSKDKEHPKIFITQMKSCNSSEQQSQLVFLPSAKLDMKSEIYQFEKNQSNRFSTAITNYTSSSNFFQIPSFLIKSKPLSFTQQISQHLQKAKCIGNNQCLMMCCSIDCQENAIICGIKKCQCKIKHKKCFTTQFQSFIENYQRKLNNQNKIIQETQEFFMNLIDQISIYSEKIIQNLKGIFFTQAQHQLIQKINKQDFQSLKGKQLSLIFTNIKQQKQGEQQKQNIKNILDSLTEWKNQSVCFLKQFQKQLHRANSIQNADEQIDPLVPVFGMKLRKIDTKILQNSEQLNILQSFFMPSKRPKKLNLLYRASEHSFEITQFYKKCSKISNTLILIRTQGHKTIGGYTSFPWDKHSTSSVQFSDPACESFIFSLTQNDKFPLLTPQYATYYLQSSPGPRFGRNGYADLWICNHSDEANLSYVFGNMAYKNEKYKQDSQSYQRFLGGQTEYFKTKQWEVFQVIY